MRRGNPGCIAATRQANAGSNRRFVLDEYCGSQVVVTDRTEKAVRKQAELIGSLQTGLASLEARLADYQAHCSLHPRTQERQRSSHMMLSAPSTELLHVRRC